MATARAGIADRQRLIRAGVYRRCISSASTANEIDRAISAAGKGGESPTIPESPR
jgi:DNA-binding NarL/FixJ family response regulator